MNNIITPNTKNEKLPSKLQQKDVQQINQQKKKKITVKEREALKFILNDIQYNKDGNFSISCLVNKSNISRPVFTNLLLKLQQNNDIIITNCGVKGTHIEILNTDILKSGEI